MSANDFQASVHDVPLLAPLAALSTYQTPGLAGARGISEAGKGTQAANTETATNTPSRFAVCRRVSFLSIMTSKFWLRGLQAITWQRQPVAS